MYFQGALNQYLKRLEDEKTLIENQLKDFELRIEQEAKAYYKVNDERRMYVSEISQTSALQDAVRKQPNDAAHVTRENPGNKVKKSEKKKMPVKKISKANVSPKTNMERRS
ncbi:coiled-coil domain-containing protein 169 [Pyxicephalus adspersus]|uniref:coiled-coil domain-containing protein 169 n=1 Tax=Pyxicephalus adspersus TaxID=30357 RepID=UPI003B5B3777